MIKRNAYLIQVFATCISLLLSAHLWVETHDIVISNGRVIDPESGLDAIRYVGITGNRITSISKRKLRGRQEIDATGLVVAPGFIDTHVHGQTQFGSKLMLRDGVTTTLDMEVGGLNTNAWYATTSLLPGDTNLSPHTDPDKDQSE